MAACWGTSLGRLRGSCFDFRPLHRPAQLGPHPSSFVPYLSPPRRGGPPTIADPSSRASGLRNPTSRGVPEDIRRRWPCGAVMMTTSAVAQLSNTCRALATRAVHRPNTGELAVVARLWPRLTTVPALAQVGQTSGNCGQLQASLEQTWSSCGQIEPNMPRLSRRWPTVSRLR